MKLVSTERDTKLRRVAFVTLQRFIRQSTKHGVVEKHFQLYDAEAEIERHSTRLVRDVLEPSRIKY